MILVHLMLGSVWAADCRTSTSAEQIGATLQDAQLAYATLDEDGFREAAERVETQLACVGEVVPAPTAASYHRVMALRAFLDGDAEAAAAAFQSALAIEPAYELSSKIAPEGGKLSRTYEGAKERPDPSTEAVKAPSDARVWVNGVPATERPVEVPVIVQLVVSNKPKWTVWLPAGEDLPADIAGGGGSSTASRDSGGTATTKPRVVDSNRNGIPDDQEVADLSEEELLEQELDEEELDGAVDLAKLDEPDRGRKPAEKSTAERDQERVDRSSGGGGGGSGGMWAAAAGTGAVGLGAFGSAVLFRSQFDNDPTAFKYHMTNGSYYTSIGLGTVALGLAGAAIAGGGK